MVVMYELIVLHITLSRNTGTCSYNNQKAQKQLLYAKMANGQYVQLLCSPAWEGDNCTCMHVWVFCHWCVHVWSCCCRGFVEAYRDLICDNI